MAKRGKLTVSRLLSRADIQGLVDEFASSYMPDAEVLVLIYSDDIGPHVRIAGDIDNYVEVLGFLEVAKALILDGEHDE